MDIFLTQHNSKTLKTSIESFLEGTKSIVTEKYEFEYRDESISIAVFEFLGLLGFW